MVHVVIMCFSDFPVVTNLASTALSFAADLPSAPDVDRLTHLLGVLRQVLVAMGTNDGGGRFSNQAAMAWHKKAYTDLPC